MLSPSQTPNFLFGVRTAHHCATMNYLSGFVVFLLVLTAEANVGNSTEESFCSETSQCLFFNLTCQTDKYEVRRYASVKVVSTTKTSLMMEFAVVPMFERLHNYITGKNEEGKNLEMTAPVIVKTPEKMFYKNGAFTMSYVLPAEYQMNPPKPTCDDVYIEEMKEMSVYVTSYGGWMLTVTDSWFSDKLSCALDSINAKYTEGFHYSVGYNSPTTILNRHNEVWYVVEGKPACLSTV